MKRILLLLMGLILSFSALSHPFIEGEHYTSLEKSVTDDTNQGATIISFFSFFCIHCYYFESVYHINEKIDKSLPDNVASIKYHVDLFGGELSSALTHAWAIAIALNVESKVLSPIFEGVQQAGSITDQKTLKQVFINAANISSEEYDTAWDSDRVLSLIERQKRAVSATNIRSVPSVLVNGKHLVINNGLNTESLSNFTKDYLNLIDFLIKKQSS